MTGAADFVPCPTDPPAADEVARPIAGFTTAHGFVCRGLVHWYAYPDGWNGLASTRLGPFETGGDAAFALEVRGELDAEAARANPLRGGRL